MSDALPLPPPLQSPEAAGSESIDERIRIVEQRLLARQRALGFHFADLSRRVRSAARPRYLLPSVLGVAATVLMLWWARGRVPAPSARVPSARSNVASLPWAPWLALAWPLLPAAWRARISPATAATVVSVGVPLVQRLLVPPAHPPLATMPHVDLARYAGTWHEIARLPTPFEAACDSRPSVHYALHGDGLHVHSQCSRRGKVRRAFGVAQVVPNSGNAKLKVSFWPSWLRWLPLAWADHWVLHVDDGYRVAMVGHPDRRHLCLLSRQPRIDDAQMGQLIRLAAERGFAIDRLRAARP
jgi:apolipoprotein D and lipocalin family protein